jgi:hypothetical protein
MAKINTENKLLEIMKFVKINISEKKKYFNHSRYEIATIDEKLLKIENFNQTNFQTLLDRCRVLIKSAREDALYIEKLKEKIKFLQEEKKLVIDKTKSVIEELKHNNLALLEKIETLFNEKTEMHKEKSLLLKRLEEIGKKTQENMHLKTELEKTKNNFIKEKNMITIHKDQEISQLWEKYKFSKKYEKDLSKSQKEKCQLQNITNEYKVELLRLKTVNILKIILYNIFLNFK